jgi:hypothetical protein
MADEQPVDDPLGIGTLFLHHLRSSSQRHRPGEQNGQITREGSAGAGWTAGVTLSISACQR